MANEMKTLGFANGEEFEIVDARAREEIETIKKDKLSKDEVPTKNSQLDNDSGFITKMVDDLANYYLKSETYTKDEVLSLVSSIPKFAIKVVTSLPTTGISTTTVYLVKSGSETDNLYTEYIYVNNKWEYLGKQTVDLSNYAKKSTTLAGYGITDGVTNARFTNHTSNTTMHVTQDEKAEWSGKSNFSGNYNDLSGKPTIPTKTSQLTNDSGFLTQHQDLSSYAKKATTLAGYGITDGATKEEVSRLSQEIVDLGRVPDYVKTEAEEVAQKILNTRTADSFVVGAATDFHTNGNDESSLGALHAGQAMDVIHSITPLDLIVLGGDYEKYDLDYDSSDTDGEDARKSFKCVRKAFHEVGKSVPVLWKQGNHDRLDSLSEAQARQQYYAYIGANNIGAGVVTDYDNKFRNYGYKDFENYKVRYFYLNSTDISDNNIIASCHMSAEQLQWFVDSLASTEEGYGVMVSTHHSLNWEGLMVNLQNILNAFKGKASGSVTVDGVTVTYDFTSVNAEFIAHIHGHLHNFRVSTYGSNSILSICIPNACFDRNNEYGTTSSYSDEIKEAYGDTDENGNQRKFSKTSGTANDTAFNILVVDRALKKIYAYCYGAGIDRELTYGEAEGGSSESLALTWNDDYRLSTSDGGLRSGATGYTASSNLDLSVLENVGDQIIIEGLNFDVSNASRSIACFAGSSFVSSYYPSQTATYPISNSGVTVMNLSADGNVVTLERVAECTDGKSYAVAFCGYGKGANATVTLKHN